MIQKVFNRYEKKYLLDQKTYGISLGQITEGGSEFAVGTTILADDDGGSLRVCLLDMNGIL